MSYKILLSGYFGFDNVGDEAILHAMVQGIKKELPDADLVALSAKPELTSLKNNIRAIDRMSIIAIMKEMKSADLFISGGGSLFQDVTSKRSILYYLGTLFIAKNIFKKKVMIYSQGIGPVIHEDNRKKLGKMFKKLDLINVRDIDSANELKDMGVTKNVNVTIDSVFSLDTPDGNNGKRLLKDLGVDTTKLTVGISVRGWKDQTDNIVTEFADAIEKLKDEDINIVLLPFHFPHDVEVSKQIFEKVNGCNNSNCKVHIIEELMDEVTFLSVMANVDIMLSMRLHGLIFGAVCNAYPIGISYDPKIQSLLLEMGRDKTIEVEDLNSAWLINEVKMALANVETLKEETREVTQKLREKAQRNNKMVKELLSENTRS